MDEPIQSSWTHLHVIFTTNKEAIIITYSVGGVDYTEVTDIYNGAARGLIR